MDVEWFSWARQVQQSKFALIFYLLAVVVRLLFSITFKSLDSKHQTVRKTLMFTQQLRSFPHFSTSYVVSRAFALIMWFPALFYWLRGFPCFSTGYVAVSGAFFTGHVVSGAFPYDSL